MSSIDSGGITSWQAALLQAAGKGDENKVRELVQECGPRSDKVKDALRIALQKVAGRGHEALTRLLLEEGAEVNAASESELSPLHRGAELGRDKIVKALLEYGALTEARDKSKRTAIFPAALKSHCSTLHLLLEAGADFNARDGNDQNLMLCLASERSEKRVKGRNEVIKILLGTEIDLEAKDKDGRTALLWAAATGKEEFAGLLLTCRAQGNSNIKATNSRGKTALHLAAENNHPSLVKLLLENGANPHVRSDGGWTALINTADKGHLEVASLLLRWNANVNATTSSGMTALHWAARNGHISMVEMLLQQEGVKRNYKDSFDSTPMLGAAENGHLEIVQLLSPADDGKLLSKDAHGACKGFQATVVDFGMENRPMNHSKYSVFDVLYGQDEKRQKPLVTTLVRNIPAKPTFRWIHLPANNMTWVETLITKHFVENSASDVEGYKTLEKSFGQQHVGPTIHSHFMRPLCQRMPPTAKDPPSSDLSESTADTLIDEVSSIATSKLENSSVFEKSTPEKTPKRSGKKVGKVEKTQGSGLNGITSRKTSGGLATSSRQADRKQFERSKTPMSLTPRRLERNGNIVLFMPYLHYETHTKRKQMSEAIEKATSTIIDQPYKPNASCSDEMLVQAYLRSTHNLHIRRTLDQFYYHAISTEDRDEDQVVYRYTRDKGKERKVFMVDQLWLWILDKDLIITSFPQRWEQPKNDPLNVLDGVIEDMSSKTQAPVKSVYDLAILVTGRCSGVFDRHRLGDEDYQFLDMFESSIGEVTNKETELFKKFNDASVAAVHWLRLQRQQGRSQVTNIPSNDNDPDKDPTFVDTLLDIGAEITLLSETKDIRDELNMISMVLKHQVSILDDLTNALLHEVKGSNNQQRQAEIKKRFREQQRLVEVHIKDVERMDKQAEGIYTSLTHLLDLKQKHANAFEARFARDQAAFTGRQGQTIMVFTIVTAVFLPMSFIAAVFAIPIREFPHLDGTPSLSFAYVCKYLFGIGLAISIPLIAVAFAVDNIGLLIKRSLRSLIAWKSNSNKRRGSQSQRRSSQLDDVMMEEVKLGRRSGDTYRARSSYEMDIGSDFDAGISPARRVQYRADRGWRDKQDVRASMRISRDLERGVGVR